MEKGWKATRGSPFQELVGQAQFFEEFWHKTFGLIRKEYGGRKPIMGEWSKSSELNIMSKNLYPDMRIHNAEGADKRIFGRKLILLAEYINATASPWILSESIAKAFVGKGVVYKYNFSLPVAKTFHLFEEEPTGPVTARLPSSITSSLFFKLWDPRGTLF